MRTCETDYTNTVIYKISCKDPFVTDLYVGHTTDFTKRLKSHRHACGDATAQNKLYTFMREHGGWQNWKMEMVYFFGCNGLSEAREKEQEYFVSLGATLNGIEPYPKSETKEESASVLIDNITVVNECVGSYKFFCKDCDFKCNKMSNYNMHLQTGKHDNEIVGVNVKQHICGCGKEYSFRQGLHLHKTKCRNTNTNDQLIRDILIQNKEIIQLLKSNVVL
jgi:predicted GIY-YIG superfamily endonuclease